MSVELEHIRVGSWPAIVLQNDAISVAVVPEIGGKIISLRSRRSGHEWLWKNPHLSLKSPPADSDDFGAFDAGGWDEVFPTVNPCRVPNSAWGDRQLTDHGELWFRSWQVLGASVDSQSGATLTLAVDEPDLPFRFARSLKISDGEPLLNVSYSVSNKSALPLPFIWAAHPLLAIKPGDLIHLPDNTRMSSTYHSRIKLAENAAEFAWPRVPLASGEQLDVSRVPEGSARFAIKLFAHDVREIAIANREQNEVFRLSFDAYHRAHCGLWLNFGAWSGANTPPYHNVGIEPTNLPYDDLKAAAHDQTALLAAGATKHWNLKVAIGDANCLVQPAPSSSNRGRG